MAEYYYVVEKSSGLPITTTGNLGTYVALWNNPISAYEWAEAQSNHGQLKFYVMEINLPISGESFPQPPRKAVEI